MFYKNKETGEILTRKQMLKDFRDLYDGDDPTNALSWEEYYDEIEDSLKARIANKAKELDWGVDFGQNSDESKWVEFSKYSPAGEDFSFTVFYDEDEDIVDGVFDYYEDFDTEEHIEQWIEAKKAGVSGVPSVKELCEDAEDIEEMIETLGFLLRDVLYEWNDSESFIEDDTEEKENG